MIFSSPSYRLLNQKLRRRYSKEIQAFLKRTRKNSASQSFAWVQDHKSEMEDYSSLNWFVLNQLKAYEYFANVELPDQASEESFSKDEDELFERWNKSEFADVFLKNLNLGLTLKKASEKTLKVFDQHLLSVIKRHILKVNDNQKNYGFQTSLGEIKKNGKITKLLETTLHFEGKDVQLKTATLKEMKEFSQKIERALKLIKKFSPSSYDRFLAFTEVIIPIKDKEFISYSHQDLPGYSMINLYHRDFVDLMDDLLHENGHHHLNYYLNLSKLIDEHIDEIYYSPWRRTPRPLRGIYHAYFTFFWAFKLFSDLATAKEMDSIWYQFSDKEKEKIYWRAIEEYWMLDFTYQDLLWAKRQGLINEKGWELISEQRKELLKFKKKISLLEKKLKVHKVDLKNLKLELKTAQKNFKKN